MRGPMPFISVRGVEKGSMYLVYRILCLVCRDKEFVENQPL